MSTLARDAFISSFVTRLPADLEKAAGLFSSKPKRTAPTAEDIFRSHGVDPAAGGSDSLRPDGGRWNIPALGGAYAASDARYRTALAGVDPPAAKVIDQMDTTNPASFSAGLGRLAGMNTAATPAATVARSLPAGTRTTVQPPQAPMNSFLRGGVTAPAMGLRSEMGDARDDKIRDLMRFIRSASGRTSVRSGPAAPVSLARPGGVKVAFGEGLANAASQGIDWMSNTAKTHPAAYGAGLGALVGGASTLFSERRKDGSKPWLRNLLLGGLVGGGLLGGLNYLSKKWGPQAPAGATPPPASPKGP